MSCGIIIGSDEKQEWMLPWWYENYITHNLFPITFIDFGLSYEAKRWCQERGLLFQLPSLSFYASKEQTDINKIHFWEAIYDGRNWWEKRPIWHQKPFAMLYTVYDYAIWIDIDCEVLAPLDDLFVQLKSDSALLIAEETKEAQDYDLKKGGILPGEILYNSGVVGFRKESQEIKTWAHTTAVEHNYHWSDQNLLSRLIFENKWRVQKLNPLYNWRILTYGPCSDAKIVHWIGEMGKVFISQKIQNLL